jgi:hypothetical protein
LIGGVLVDDEERKVEVAAVVVAVAAVARGGQWLEIRAQSLSET